MPDPIFLELLDHIGIEPSHLTDAKTGEPKEHPNAGEPGPLVAEGCSFAVPTIVGDEIVPVARSVKILPSETQVAAKPAALDDTTDVTTAARIIPGSRQIETVDPLIADVLLQAGYRQVDPPKSNAKARAASGKGEPDTGSEG